MFDRRSILIKAWAAYRFQMRYRDAKGFDRVLFAEMLRNQWAAAKADAVAAAERAAEAARLATAAPAEVRADAIRAELRDMEMTTDFINWTRRAALGAELARIAA